MAKQSKNAKVALRTITAQFVPLAVNLCADLHSGLRRWGWIGRPQSHFLLARPRGEPIIMTQNAHRLGVTWSTTNKVSSQQAWFASRNNRSKRASQIAPVAPREHIQPSICAVLCSHYTKSYMMSPFCYLNLSSQASLQKQGSDLREP